MASNPTDIRHDIAVGATPGGFAVGRRGMIATVKRFIDPLTIQATLLAVFFWHDEPLRGHSVLLALFTFLLTYPGNLPFRSRQFRLLGTILSRWAVTAAVILATAYLSDTLESVNTDAVIAWLFAAPLAVWGLHLVSPWLVPRVLRTQHKRRAAVIGANGIGARLVRTINAASPDTRVEAVFDDRDRKRWDPDLTVACGGGLADVADYVRRNDISLLYIALPMASQPRTVALLEDLADTTCSIYFVPDVFVFDLVQARIDLVGEIPVLAVCESPFQGTSLLLKRASDIVFAATALGLLAPLMLGIALALRVSSPGPVFFRQRRHGLDGQEIVVWKFRTMRVAEDGDRVPQARPDDARVTPLGRLLRRTSMDELPQLLNVLRGDMSMVGPRPHALAHNRMYRQLIRGYMVRHKVKPGITGWAQVNGARGETETVDKMRRRIELDMYYLRHWSIGLDLLILLRTFTQVLRNPNAY